MLREMTVSGLTIDPFTNSPIMILKDVDSDKAVPIWIGLLEATAIASELENIKFSRPMTHDLLKNVFCKKDERHQAESILHTIRPKVAQQIHQYLIL